MLNSKAELLSGELSDELLERLENTGILLFPRLDLTVATRDGCAIDVTRRPVRGIAGFGHVDEPVAAGGNALARVGAGAYRLRTK